MSDRDEQQRRMDCVETGECPSCGAQIGDAGICQDLFDGCPHCGDDLDYDSDVASSPGDDDDWDA